MLGCVDMWDYVCNNRVVIVYKNCVLIFWYILMYYYKFFVFCVVCDFVYVLI